MDVNSTAKAVLRGAAGEAAMKPPKWTCPKCGAEPEKHGKGSCIDLRVLSGQCYGFLCECGVDNCGTYENPCEEAHCYHCGWMGVFPPPKSPKFDPKKLRGWAKQAWAAGWKPPGGWTP